MKLFSVSILTAALTLLNSVSFFKNLSLHCILSNLGTYFTAAYLSLCFSEIPSLPFLLLPPGFLALQEVFFHSLFINHHLFLIDFIYFLFREEEREKQRERNINVWLPLVRPLLGTWPESQACALTLSLIHI